MGASHGRPNIRLFEVPAPAPRGEDTEDSADLTSEEEDVEALLSLAQLDAETAAAFDLAADVADDAALELLLRRCADEHRRHRDAIHEFARDRDYLLAETEDAVASSAIVRLASAIGELHPVAALQIVMGQEELTNVAYDTALWLLSGKDALDLVRRHREDERLHREDLVAYIHVGEE